LTRLIRIHITWSDSADACTCGEYFCLPPSYVLQVLQWINPPYTRLALNEFQASCYSHHKSQSVLSETNWLLRVSGCNPYLESLPNYIDGAPPWTPTNMGHGITSRPLKHDPEISPRDSKELCTHHILYIFKQTVIFIMLINLMPTFIIHHHTCSMLNPFQIIIPNSWI